MKIGMGEMEGTRTEPDKTREFFMRDIVFSGLFLICGIAYIDWIIPFRLGLGVTLFTLLFAAVTAAYFLCSGIKLSRESIGYLAVIGLAAGNFFVSDAILLKCLLFLYLSGLAVYWTAVTTERRIIAGITADSVWDLVNQLICVPFSNFSCAFHSIKGLRRDETAKRGGSIGSILLGILLCIPVLLIVVGLLIQADFAFAHVVECIGAAFTEQFWHYLIEVLLGIPVACYLYGLVYGNIKNRKTSVITLEQVRQHRAHMQCAPKLTVYTVLTILNLVYLVFFLSQTGYLFSAFRNTLPELMTYSEYARHGFFELCLIAGINLGVLGVLHLFLKRDSENELVQGAEEELKTARQEVETARGMKLETVVLSGFTLFLIVTAVSKMALYIHYYGLTRLRVYTSWFMILLFLLFCVIIARQFKKFNGSKGMFVVFTVCFLLLCYGNVDGLIAKYNVERYEAGTLASFDPYDYTGLSAGAVPYLAELYEQVQDPGVKAGLYYVITKDDTPDEREKLNWSSEDFRGYNLQSARAQRIAEQVADAPPKNIESYRTVRICNGKHISLIDSINKKAQIELPENAVIEMEAPRMNGTFLAKAMISDADAAAFQQQLSKNLKWKPFPLTEELYAYLYGGVYQGSYYGSNRAKEAGIPVIQNGFWYMVNNDGEADSGSVISPEHGSVDITLALYDLDSQTLYLMKGDL